MANSPNVLFDWRIRGIPSDVWVRFSDSIGQLIAKEKLTPVDARFLTTPNQVNFAMAGAAQAAAETVKAEAAPKAKSLAREFFDIRGGMKALHVHYKGEIYLLNDAQWKRFTSMVVTDFKAKLDAAGAIGFDQTLDIAEAANRIG